MRVLGVDPGLQCLGYGVVEFLGSGRKIAGRISAKSNLRLIEAGFIKTSYKQPLTQRLKKIYSGLTEIIEAFNPQVLALEELYSHYQNPKTAIMMAHARGVICLAAAECGIDVVGYAATRVKKSITGAGAAQKPQVQKSIKEILGLDQVPNPHDVADALAIAITHINVISRKI